MSTIEASWAFVTAPVVSAVEAESSRVGYRLVPSLPAVVRVSSRYQIVIPPEVWAAARIAPGSAELRGTVRRDDSGPIRDEEDRF